MKTIKAWAIVDKETGNLRISFNSWTDTANDIFKTRIAAEVERSYDEKVVKVEIKIIKKNEKTKK